MRLAWLGSRPLFPATAAAAALSVLLTTAGCGLQADRDAPGGEAATSSATVAPRIRMVQANLRQGTPVKKFQADVHRVLATDPDFVTYNEVANRHTGVLAPAGYALWRGQGRYKGEAAVAWNARRWRAIAHGVTRLTASTGKVPGARHDWGLRYANWVTLRNGSGRTISVVSAHFPPDTKITKHLVAPAAKHLGALTDRLGSHGPVLVGGDLNVPYNSTRYPSGIFARHRLFATYDVLRARAITSGTNVTIDYLLVRGVARFAMRHQFTLKLNSDHNAVGVDLNPIPAGGSGLGFGSGGVLVSDPTGPAADQRSILRATVAAVRNAPKGAAIHLSTSHLGSSTLVSSLLDARHRGVRVQVVLGNPARSTIATRLRRVLGAKVADRSWAVSSTAASGRLPASLVLLSRSGTSKAVRLTSEAALDTSATRPWQRVTIQTELPAYDRAFRAFFSAVGRDIG